MRSVGVGPPHGAIDLGATPTQPSVPEEVLARFVKLELHTLAGHTCTALMALPSPRLWALPAPPQSVLTAVLGAPGSAVTLHASGHECPTLLTIPSRYTL